MSDLSRYTADLPAELGKLKTYKDIAFQRYQAEMHAVKALETLEGSEQQQEEMQHRAGEHEIRAWLADARIGELLGPGDEVQKAGKPLEGFPKDMGPDNRKFARRFYEVLQSGELGKAIEKVESQGPIAYRLPIALPAQAYNSGVNEWYTPKEYADAARSVMGGIDLDPASTAEANEIIRATRFFTAAEDGLQKKWTGRVFMNPPYSSEVIKLFIEKFCDEVTTGNIIQGIVLVNNATETSWFFLLGSVCDMVCFPSGRIRFWNPDKESATPLQGQAVLYFGENRIDFYNVFSSLGRICEIKRAP